MGIQALQSRHSFDPRLLDGHIERFGFKTPETFSHSEELARRLQAEQVYPIYSGVNAVYLGIDTAVPLFYPEEDPRFHTFLHRNISGWIGEHLAVTDAQDIILSHIQYDNLIFNEGKKTWDTFVPRRDYKIFRKDGTTDPNIPKTNLVVLAGLLGKTDLSLTDKRDWERLDKYLGSKGL